MRFWSLLIAIISRNTLKIFSVDLLLNLRLNDLVYHIVKVNLVLKLVVIVVVIAFNWRCWGINIYRCEMF